MKRDDPLGAILEMKILGSLLGFLVTVLIGLLFARPNWFQKRLGFLFGWGPPGFRYRASKMGTFFQLMVLLVFSLGPTLPEASFIQASFADILFKTVVLVGIPIAMFDYVIH